MTEQNISDQFTGLLGPVLKVLDSCQNPIQLKTGYDWATNLIIGLRDHIGYGGDTKEMTHAETHSEKALHVLLKRYCKMGGVENALTLILDEDVVIREVKPHLSVCRSCGGSGVDAKTGLKSCHYCRGTGRVKVASVIRTMIRPFIPGEDDPRLPLKM